MSPFDHRFSDGGGKPAAQAYWNALRRLREAWRTVFDEELTTSGSGAKDQYLSAVEEIERRLRSQADKRQELRQELDVAPDEDIAETVLALADLDDLAPNEVKGAIYAEAQRLVDEGRREVELHVFLRAVLDVLFSENRTRRPNVGVNRHWPRLLQYVREAEWETDWSPDGRGLRLANAGGGRVAQEPRDPRKLRLIFDSDYL